MPILPDHVRPYFACVKKLRGQRRHQRRAIKWQRLTTALALGAQSYDYRKIGLHPWSSWFFRRQPPAPIRRTLLQGLLRTHSEWLRELQAQPTPFYLAVWLFENPFSSSQVVAAIHERIAHYESVFETSGPASSPLPPEYRRVPGVESLHWRAHVEIEADYDPPQRRVKNYRQAHTSDGQLLHVWEGARVWVGRAQVWP